MRSIKAVGPRGQSQPCFICKPFTFFPKYGGAKINSNGNHLPRYVCTIPCTLSSYIKSGDQTELKANSQEQNMGDKGLPESRTFVKRKVLRAGRQGAKLVPKYEYKEYSTGDNAI